MQSASPVTFITRCEEELAACAACMILVNYLRVLDDQSWVEFWDKQCKKKKKRLIICKEKLRQGRFFFPLRLVSAQVEHLIFLDQASLL